MGDGAEVARAEQAAAVRRPVARPPVVFPAPEFDLLGTVGNQALLPLIGPAAATDATPRRSDSDTPARGRVRRSDIAGRGRPPAGWHAQFAPQKPPVDPTHVSSIAAAQAWVKDLGGFTVEEKRRFKIGQHLKSMIEGMPPEVWLPSGDVISRRTTKNSSLVVTGVRDPIDTDQLRNKLYTMYLSVDRPAELTRPRDATGLDWPEDIEQFVTADEQAAADRLGLQPDLRPFRIDYESLTRGEVEVLEFLFPDGMLEWRRRDVEVQESVEREGDRRTGVFMAALGEGSITAIGQFFKYTALAGIGAAATPVVAGRVAGGLGVESLASAGWGTRFLVATGTGEVIGAGQGAVDSAITNLPDVISGDLSVAEYASGVAHGTWEGAKLGGAFGAAGSVASEVLSRFGNLFRSSSRVLDPPARPNARAREPRPPVVKRPSTTPPPAAPAPVVEPVAPAAPLKVPRAGWARRRLRDVLVKLQLGVTEAEVVPSMQIGSARGANAALVDPAAGSVRTPGTPTSAAPSTPGRVAPVADAGASAAVPATVAEVAPAAVPTPAATPAPRGPGVVDRLLDRIDRLFGIGPQPVTPGGLTAAVPRPMESRGQPPSRTTPTTVADLKPAPVHPSKNVEAAQVDGWKVNGDGTVTVEAGDRTATITPGAAGNGPRLATELGITRDQASQALRDITADVAPQPTPPPGQRLLISFVQNKGDPVKWALSRLHDRWGEHRWDADAFIEPATEVNRSLARVPGDLMPESLRLSDVAYVFVESPAAPFTPIQSKTAATVTEYSPRVNGKRGSGLPTDPRAVVRVDPDGVVVEILGIARNRAGEPAMDVGALVALMRAAGWRVTIAGY